jgi:hypothetical protein
VAVRGSEQAYLEALARREVDAVQRQGSGAERGRRPHLPPMDRVRMTAVSNPGGGMGSRSRSRPGTAADGVRGGPHGLRIGPSCGTLLVAMAPVLAMQALGLLVVVLMTQRM